MSNTLPNVTIELIHDTEQDRWTAHLSDIPAYGEGASEQEAIDDLKTGIQLFVEENGIEATILRINSPSHIREVNLEELVAHG